MIFTIPKANRCKHCKLRMPAEKARHVLHDDCIDPWLAVQSEKKARKAAKDKRVAQVTDKRETKGKLDALRTKPQLVKLAQTAFNSFIRGRDAGKPCISCGTPLQASAVGGAFDCGHYRSVGSSVHMRFVEDNAHGQCKHCNRHLSGNYVAYRAGLIERVGLTAVEHIEADTTLRKYSKEGLIELARHYNQAANRLKHAHEALL